MLISLSLSIEKKNIYVYIRIKEREREIYIYIYTYTYIHTHTCLYDPTEQAQINKCFRCFIQQANYRASIPSLKAARRGRQEFLDAFTSPKGTCTQTVYTSAPKYLYRDYFKANAYTVWVHGPLLG